ncbi:MAG TPA: gamma-glutamyltransferase [Thermodesulfobacteriota bacterium]|nr:gamma-glutamyltransferase [Thermodesulfobacteriota bacterium]
MIAHSPALLGCVALLLVPAFGHGREKAPAAAAHGMVASAHPLASRAGVDILKAGGNAVDAAAAAAFTLGVVEPYASGIGGGGFIVLYLSGAKKIVAIDARETAPRSAAPEIYRDKSGRIDWDSLKTGYRSVAVPGIVAGLALALEKFGTLDLARVLAPAIDIAERGFPVTPGLSKTMETFRQKLLRFPEAKKLFLKNGAPYPAGERIVFTDLGASLTSIARQGAPAFYTGAIAHSIAEHMKKSRGLITREDLSGYQPVFRDPVRGTYRGYEIVSMAPPSSGGTHLIQFLNILEGYPLRLMGHNSSATIRLLAETMKRIFADRARYMGDPDFVKVPVGKLTSKAYAALIRKEMKITPAISEIPPNRESDQTTHLSVADGSGNLVSLTQTINAFLGSGVVVPGTGFLLNNEMRDFDPLPGRPNSIQPLKRPVSSMSPTIVLKDGRPFLSIGMPGSVRIISVLPQILINIIDFGMDLQRAIDAPRIHVDSGEIWMEPRVPERVRAELAALGYKLVLKKDFDLWFGGAQGIMIRDGQFLGGADPRREGSVAGY